MAQRIAPGGASSLCLGSDAPQHAARAVAPPQEQSYQAPALAAGERTGTSGNSFAQGSNQNCGNVMTERSSTGVRQAPGGSSSLVLGGGYPGDSTLTFGDSSAAEAFAGVTFDRSTAPAPGCAAGSRPVASSSLFANGANQNSGNGITDRPSTAVRCAPGGNSTLTFGDSSAAEAFAGVTLDRSAASAPGCAAGSRPVASSSLFANGANQNSGNGITDRPSTAVRCAPGGASTLVLGGDEPVEAAMSSRAAPGGASTLVLGMSEGETFQRDANAPNRSQEAVAIAAAVAAHAAAPDTRVAPGGASSVVLGTETFARDTHAPNRTSGDVAMAAVAAAHAAAPDQRVAPGGSTTILLGQTPVRESFTRDGGDPNRASIEVIAFAAAQALEEAADERVVPGGASTVVLGTETFVRDLTAPNLQAVGVAEAAAAAAHAAAADHRVAPGGASSVVLGTETFVRDLTAPNLQVAGVAEAAAAAAHADAADHRVAPGGASSVVLGTDAFVRDMNAPHRQSVAVAEAAVAAAHAAAADHRVAPGGATSVVLGTQDADSENNPNIINVSIVTGEKKVTATAAAPFLTRRRQAPGGEATVVLG